MISVTFLDVAKVFSLLKVKLNLKICTRRKPLLIFFLKAGSNKNYQKKARKIHVKQFMFRYFNSSLQFYRKMNFFKDDFKEH